ncbi:MAG TPA: methyltransferase domain-containing protein [Thermoleophilaceae bacterium]|nr:methyltransferase domain-containing protein [Thermoleophilaceae bacterium]
MSSGAASRDWDAATYDRISDPQVAMAGPVLDRLSLRGDETVLDAGCGSGRVTQLLLERLPRGRVIAVDAAPSMVEEARRALADRATVLQADLHELTLPEPVDAAFSNAVFHWVLDHDRLFERLFAALRPGGRLVAQCGGEGNIGQLRRVAGELAKEPPYAQHFEGWSEPWHYASPREARRRLLAAGFEDVETWLEPWPVHPPEPLQYLRAVCLGSQVERLPEDLRDDYVETVAARCGEPLTLDYVRLNIDARRPVCG